MWQANKLTDISNHIECISENDARRIGRARVSSGTFATLTDKPSVTKAIFRDGGSWDDALSSRVLMKVGVSIVMGPSWHSLHYSGRGTAAGAERTSPVT